MDKTEYRMRLDEINRLVEAQDYEGALEIVDSIEWRRVRSVRTLCMVADIYEVNGELEESMKMLQLAYKRSSVGKMILYRQVELSLKMGLYDDAVEYYNRYLETASNDTSKYILKYKIYKAQDAPLEEQIAILEEYKNREYTERWVYELAKLYQKAGKQNKCVATCDDLILWFGEGKYVTKAMELKMTYVPLTPAQKAKYDQRSTGEKKVVREQKRPAVTAATVDNISAAAMASLQKASIIPGDGEVKKDKALIRPAGMEEAAAAVEEAEYSAAAEPKKEEKIKNDTVMPAHVDAAQLQEKLARSFQEVLSGFNRTKVVNAFEALGRATGSELTPETVEEENIEDYQVTDLEPETANETKISAERREAIAHRTEKPEIMENPEVKAEKPEDKEVTSIQDIDLEALFAETSGMFAQAAESRQAEKESEIEEVPEEEIVEKEPIQKEPVEETAAQKSSAEETEKVQQPELSEDAAAAMAAFEASLLIGLEDMPAAEENKEADPRETEDQEEVPEDVTASEEESGSEEADISEETDIPKGTALTEEMDLPEKIDIREEIDIPEEINIPEETDAELNGEESDENAAELAEEAEIVEPDEEKPDEMIVEIPEEMMDQTEAVQEEVMSEPQEEEPVDMPEISIEDIEFQEDDVKIAHPAGGYQEINLEQELLAVLGDQPGEEQESSDDFLARMQSLVQDETGAEREEETKESSETPNIDGDVIPDLDLDLVLELQKEKDEPETVPALEEEAVQEDSQSQEAAEVPEVSEIPERETPEEKRFRIMNATRPERLTEEQKRLFSYFSKIPGMDEQILEALEGVYLHADEKTSRRGNIAIMGSHGTGKTRLSEGLVKAICKELGLEAVKYANLDASDMNRKDPAMIIGKMSGGFLLIERASYMTAETIQKLSQAMDFRTDSMILIIEDDKANMRKMLADYPEFAKKFNTVISIPVFTNDELVTFARTYAKENGYRMDEMGVLALYTLIGDNQREDEPITIGKVKEMVDRAIRRAGGARLGRRISKRHTDENGRILLYEKDFDL